MLSAAWASLPLPDPLQGADLLGPERAALQRSNRVSGNGKVRAADTTWDCGTRHSSLQVTAALWEAGSPVKADDGTMDRGQEEEGETGQGSGGGVPGVSLGP